MLEVNSLSIENLGQLAPADYVSPTGHVSAGQISPGWYYDSVVGWYYVDLNGNTFSGNPHTGQVYGPLYYVAGYDIWNPTVYAASTIGGPKAVVPNDKIKVDFKFKYSGERKTITVKVGHCTNIIPGTLWNEGNFATVDVVAGPFTSPTDVSGTATFSMASTWVGPKEDLFVKISGTITHIAAVYTDAFNLVTSEIKDLEITNYDLVK